MSTHLRHLSPSSRTDRAIEKVLEEGWAQAEAARWAGVAPETVNRKLKKVRAAQVEREERAAFAAVERAGGPLDDQKRRVPAVGEFVRTYFDGPLFACWNCGVRHEIPAFHDEIMGRMVDPKEKRLLVNIPPEHSKSTNGTVYTSTHGIVEDPNIQIGIISAGEDLAGDMLAQISTLLSDPEMYEGCTRNLIDDFGPFNEGTTTWNKKKIIVTGRHTSQRDPTVQSFGIDSKIYGRRYHRIICDDIADVDNQSNPENVVKMFRKVTSTLDSRVGSNGKLLILGTRVAPNDIYSMLLGLDDYTVLRHPCILDYENRLTLWPEHVSFDEAMKRKGGRMTAEMFELIYQNSDLMGEGAVFTQAHFDRCHDESRTLGQVPKGAPITLVIGVDPGGHGKQAGHTAMVLLGVDRASGMRYLIDVVNARSMTAPQMQAQIFDWVERYRPYSVRFETVGLQIQIFDTKEYRSFLTEHGTRIDWHRTNAKGGVAGKWDPNWGVESIAPVLHNAMVSIPWGDRETQRAVRELEEQFRQFPMEGGKTDLMMAYWIAETGCRLLTERAPLPNYRRRGANRLELPARLRRQRRIVNTRTGVERAPGAKDFAVAPYDPLDARKVRLANMVVEDGELAEMLTGEAR